MRFVSLFSGIEAASLAWIPLGWECVAFAEIDKFPCSVLKHRYPGIPNLGDVQKITQDQVIALGHIDVVVFGFPCQDLSVAGKRAGLEGERSGLFFDAMRIVRWSNARWAVAENVPGLFSSNEGLDFARVVGEMAGVCLNVPDGGWANSGVLAGTEGLVEWGTLDAQYFGVPQRRRRVFLVRDIGDWRSRPPVLLEPHCLQGHPAPRREKGKRVAPCLDARTDGGGAGWGTDFMAGGGLLETVPGPTHSGRGYRNTGESRGQDPVVACELPEVAWALQERDHKSPDSDTKEGHLIPIAFSAKDSEVGFGDIAPPLRSMNNIDSHANGGGQVAVAFAIQERAVCENPDAGPDGVGVRGDDTSYTLESRTISQAVAFKPSHFTRGKDGAPDEIMPPLSADADKGDQDPVVLAAFDTTQITSKENRCNPQPGDHPLASGAHPPAIAFESRFARNGRGAPSEIIPPLKAQSGETGKGDAAPLVKSGMAVRRLLPEECEALQGFPRGFTKITDKTADGPRYKALGNSFAIPVVRWIGERIQMVEALCDPKS